MKLGQAQDLPVDPQRLIRQMAEGTIRTTMDALVELVTNSDDSYKRLEKKGIKKSGKIQISISRLKGGKCDAIEVRDYAEGMDRGALERSITFGAASSGFEEGESVRGLFGRGLKEAILSLGCGDIYTFRKGELSAVRIWWDSKKLARLAWLEVSPEDKKDLKIEEDCGTIVRITKIKDKFKIPDYTTFEKQFERYYALRDIHGSPERDIFLNFSRPQSYTDCGRATPIEFKPPEGEEIVNTSFRLPKYQDQVLIRIYQSAGPLDAPPMGTAGLLIKTEGAILDNNLFRFDEPAGLYFFGEVFCKGIADRARSGDFGLININRAGLNWKDAYCKALQKEVERYLEPHVERRRQELETKEPANIPPSNRKLLDNLQKLLNRLARSELSAEDLEHPVVFEDIEDLVVKPEVANIEVDKARSFSVYAPKFLVEASQTSDVDVVSENPSIKTLSGRVTLEEHRSRPEILYGTFKVRGSVLGAKTIISCTLGKYEAFCEVVVGPQKEGRKKGKLSTRRGGFIRSIKTDNRSDPPQRVSYNREFGEIVIYLKFSTVSKYLSEGLNGIEKVEGKITLAELVGEAFCRELARRSIELGKEPIFGDDPQTAIAAYNKVYSDMQGKYLGDIYRTIMAWQR